MKYPTYTNLFCCPDATKCFHRSIWHLRHPKRSTCCAPPSPATGFLIVGDEYQGASRLILQLLELMNGIRADHLDSVRDEYCRLVRPKSKSRRILRDDIRAVEPFLQQRAAEGKWKIAVFMDAERMNDEAANAFLKTLEEPPGQCLLILSTSQPDQLLQTIISRCVRVNLLQSGEFRLTPIQEALLPHWLETCRNLNNDLAALGFRSRFMEVMKRPRVRTPPTGRPAIRTRTPPR